METWEYKEVKEDFCLDLLNEMGQDGWEWVQKEWRPDSELYRYNNQTFANTRSAEFNLFKRKICAS